MNLKKNKNYKGFSLVEGMIATLIVGLVFVAFMVAMAKSIRSDAYARNIIIATNLAQEGIEAVRNARDNNWKEGMGAFDNTYFPSFASCIDSGDGDGDSCVTLNVNMNSRLGDAGFEREIRINGNGDKRDITSIVRNNSAGVNINIEITNTLYRWADNNY